MEVLLNKLDMKEQLIEFETAKLAKEKGFEQQPYKLASCNIKVYSPRYANDDNQIVLRNALFNPDYNIAAAPTQSLLQKWLREEHNIIVLIAPDVFSVLNEFNEVDGVWIASIIKDNKFNQLYFGNPTGKRSYEKVLEAGLLEALKLI